MAIYAFYPAASHQRRADGIGFILAEGADKASARAAAHNLIGGPSIDEFAVVEIAAGLPAVAVQGLPVGDRNQTIWPLLTRGGSFLGSAG